MNISGIAKELVGRNIKAEAIVVIIHSDTYAHCSSW